MLSYRSSFYKFVSANQALSIFLGSLLLAVCSQLSVPMYPVPITMQTLAVLLLSVVLGSRNSALAVTLYLAEGLVGLPVFANFSSGIQSLAGPTGGYLMGFVPGAYIAGLLLERYAKWSVFTMIISGAISHVIVIGLGYAWLAKFLDFEKAYHLGVEPFILGTLTKIAAFVLIAYNIRNSEGSR